MWAVPFLAALAAAAAVDNARAQYGPVFAGTGAVNRSMAGVATAAPLSPGGALFWNPATIPGLERSELEAGAELVFPHTRLASGVGASALGPGVPPVTLAGSTDSDSGAFPLPTIALAYVPEGSPVSFGLGVFALAGFGVDYAGSATNPVLTAPPPNGIGFGPIFSEYEVLQITPAAAYRVTDRLSVAAGPVVNLAVLKVDPAFFAAPDDANGNGFATFPPGAHSQTTWGGGFIAGVYYQADGWGVGASVKSPQWFDTFRYNSRDELGRPRELKFNLDLPTIVSVGASYTGWEKWIIAADLRYLDFADAHGFGDQGFSPAGAVRGVGWRSIFAAAVGAQYRLTDWVSLRAGYSWGQNPIPNSQSFFNVASTTIVDHTVYAGASWKVTDDLTLSVAYAHGFENSITGPLTTPAGPVPATVVRNSAAADLVVFSGSVKFGAPTKCRIADAGCEP
jgi:long-chain fatty acid transport protein